MRRWGGGVFLDIYKTLIYISDYLNRTAHLDIYILYLWFDSTFGDFFFSCGTTERESIFGINVIFNKLHGNTYVGHDRFPVARKRLCVLQELCEEKTG